MAQSKVFQNARAGKALAVVVASGCAAVLAACNSGGQTYRPAPNYNSPPPQPVYSSPSANPTPSPTPTPPPTPTPGKAGGGACGGGKCG
jgi:hypothetical protein